MNYCLCQPDEFKEISSQYHTWLIDLVEREQPEVFLAEYYDTRVNFYYLDIKVHLYFLLLYANSHYMDYFFVEMSL